MTAEFHILEMLGIGLVCFCAGANATLLMIRFILYYYLERAEQGVVVSPSGVTGT